MNGKRSIKPGVRTRANPSGFLSSKFIKYGLCESESTLRGEIE